MPLGTIATAQLSKSGVNDSILLVEFINLARNRGATPLAATGQASRARFRAVLLTSAATSRRTVDAILPRWRRLLALSLVGAGCLDPNPDFIGSTGGTDIDPTIPQTPWRRARA